MTASRRFTSRSYRSETLSLLVTYLWVAVPDCYSGVGIAGMIFGDWIAWPEGVPKGPGTRDR